MSNKSTMKARGHHWPQPDYESSQSRLAAILARRSSRRILPRGPLAKVERKELWCGIVLTPFRFG
jgi:hypothetical protein